MIAEVRAPTPPLPDLNDAAVCKYEFEEKNRKYRLYYTTLIVNLFRNLEQLVYEELDLKANEQYWDMNIDYLKDLIFQVKDDFKRECLERRFEDLFYLAQKRTLERYFKYIIMI